MKNAFSLSITLFISFILLALSIYFLSVSRETLKNVENLNIKLKVFLKNKSYFEKLKFFLGSGEYKNYYVINTLEGFPKKLRIDGYLYEINNTIFSLQDTSGLINIMYPDTNFLSKLIIGKDKDILIDSFKDWLDRDNLSRLNGAESYYYISHHYKYIPRNQNFVSYIEELRDIRGWEREFDNFKHFFTFFKGGNYNFSTMPSLLLKVRYNLPLNEIKKIEELKKSFKDNEIFEIFRKYSRYLDPEVDLPFPSRVIQLKVITKEQNVTACIKAVIDFKENINLYSY